MHRPPLTPCRLLSAFAIALGAGCTGPAAPPNDPLVYVATQDTRYHTEHCSEMPKGAAPFALSQVLAKGYKPCPVCKSDRAGRLLVTREKFQQLRERMTLEEVEQIVGGPGETWEGDGSLLMSPIEINWYRWRDHEGNCITAAFAVDMLVLFDYKKCR